MPNCPDCGGEHQEMPRDETLVTITVPKYQANEMLHFFLLAQAALTPGAPISLRAEAALVYMEAEKHILSSTLPMLKQIHKVLGESTPNHTQTGLALDMLAIKAKML